MRYTHTYVSLGLYPNPDAALSRTECMCRVVYCRCQAYGEAISLGGEGEALARSNRAAVYLKLGKHTEALQDASAAVKLMPTEIAFYRKG